MTVFQVSLFLPYTIEYKVPGPRYASWPPGSHSDAGNNVAGRFSKLHRSRYSKSSYLSLTSGETADHEKFFRSCARRSVSEISRSGGLSRSEQHPLSCRAHGETCSESKKCTFVDGIGEKTDSEDEQGCSSAFPSDTDWMIRVAEHGNRDLRNAINAAEEAGLLPDKLWVGTLGMPTDFLEDGMRTSIADTLKDKFESLVVFISDGEFEGHYARFCRTVLWPAFHYEMQESPRHVEYDGYSWKQYLKVNERFASIIAAHWRPGDSIWIHDYHLLLLPSMLRRKLPQAQIGFYMHSAFPSSEVFRCLSTRNELLNGLLDADLVGFQIEEYCHHFLQTCSRLLGLEVTSDSVQLDRRFVRVGSFPFGIDIKRLNELRHTTDVQCWISKICSRYHGKRLIVARDKLDRPGGIKQKLLAYELFLKRYPKWRENTVLIQVASLSRGLSGLEAEVSKTVTRVNSTYSTLTHQPVLFLRQDIGHSQFLALMSVADVFMVTSLREGMNLASREYLYCQDGEIASQHHGSLILSEFVGSASVFSGYELLVNPWDYGQCADVLNKALELTPEQKQRNWQFLVNKDAPYTAIAWFKLFGKNLLTAYNLRQYREPSQDQVLFLNGLKRSYERSGMRLFLFEEKWVVSSLMSATSATSSKPASLLEILPSDSRNLVYVIREKTPGRLEPPGIELSTQVEHTAENGCLEREVGSFKWETLVGTDCICKVVGHFQERTVGSWIEDRHCRLSFWLKNAEDSKTVTQQTSEQANQIGRSGGSEATGVALAEDTVSAKPLDITKATPAGSTVKGLPLSRTPDFLFVAGNARDNDALFHCANSQACRSIAHVTTRTVDSPTIQTRSSPTGSVTIEDVLGALVS